MTFHSIKNSSNDSSRHLVVRCKRQDIGFPFTLKLLYLSSNMSTQLAQNFPINLFVFSSLFVSFRLFAFSLLCETLVTFIELSHNLPAPIEDNQYNTIRNPRSMDKSLELLKGNYNLDILGRKSQPNAIHGLQ